MGPFHEVLCVSFTGAGSLCRGPSRKGVTEPSGSSVEGRLEGDRARGRNTS